MSIYNTPLEERFGEKLEELREGKNMTREQLAEQVGLTARHIAALERGERRPTLNTMEKLLRTLGAPTEWLIYPEFEDTFRSHCDCYPKFVERSAQTVAE